MLGGNVFTDFNFNGIADDNGSGVEGIEVYIYESTGAADASTLITQTTTDSDGNYYFTGLTDGTRYRVEFVVPTPLNYLKSSPNGIDSRTSVQYPMAPSCDVDFGVACPTDYCGSANEDVYIFTPCYITGDPLAGGNSGTGPGLVAVNYSATGSGQNVDVLQTQEIGTLWGLAYQRSTKTLFGAAALKRHSGFGPGGTGAIYVVDATDVNNSSVTEVIDMNALGCPTGADPRASMPLPSSRQLPSHDTDAYGLTGKMSFGDMEISDDGSELWVVNLFDKTLNKIAIGNPYQTPTAADVTKMPIPDPGCGGGEFRPWSLKFYKGKVYVGVVCDASISQSRADLHAYIYEHDPAGAPNNFTPVFDFPLGYQRGYVFLSNPGIDEWNPWTDSNNLAKTGGLFIRPQPILSDIEFDVDGSMILGFMDRMGQQGGFQNFSPDPTDFGYYDAYAGGDIVRVCNIGGTFVLEGTAPCTTPGGLGNNQGPNGSEYYFGDSYPTPTSGPDVHQEISLGGLALLPGSGEIVSTAYDPLLNVNTGGLIWLDNTTGGRSDNYEIYEASLGFSGKASGLGDLELSCSEAPIEIGNYVWYDPNMDGIQDPGETPIPGVRVTLFNESGDSLATVITDADGEYYFNNTVLKNSSYTADTMLQFNTQYYVVVGFQQYDLSSQLLFDTLTLTIDSTGMSVDPHLNDSDGEIATVSALPVFFGYPYTPVTTGEAGCNDHTLDFGFFNGDDNCVLAIDVINSQDESCLGAGNGTLEIILTDPTLPVNVSIDGGLTFSTQTMYSGLLPGTYQITLEELANPMCKVKATVEILPGMVIESPSDVTDYAICLNEPTPAGEGLTANCIITCSPDSTQRTTWWTAEMGGTLVAEGSIFSPVDSGLVDNTVADTTIFYVQCECGTCVSERVPALFIVNPLPPTEIDGPDFICPGESSLIEIATKLGNDVVWTLSGGGTIITQDSISVSIDWMSTQGAGPFELIATETDNNSCVNADTAFISIKNTNIACNDSIQISLDMNGTATITPDQILEGTYLNYDCFKVEITAGGVSFGDMVDCSNIGKYYLVNVKGDCDQNSCWSTISVEDKKPPIFDCPPMTDTVEVTCLLDDVAPPTAMDNCGPVTVILSNEVIDDADCETTFFKRTYIATDGQGNTSLPCMQFIKIETPETLKFPDDITWTCEQYAAFPNVIEAVSLHPYILANAEKIDTANLYCQYEDGDDVPFITPYHDIYMYWLDNEDLDVSLDPRYDDNYDNPINDPFPSICGTPTQEVDTRTDLFNISLNVGCPYLQDCDVTPNGHYPTFVETPLYNPAQPANGLEDADILAMTGSGIPELMDSNCPYHVTFKDQRAEACPGADSSSVFKIFRTWKIINSCTGELYTDVQIIKVVDRIAPIVNLQIDTLIAGNTTATPYGNECTSTATLPPPDVIENCGGSYTVKIFTPIGEAVYVNGIDGTNGGAIPSPGLPIGTHTIQYNVTDACGNYTEATTEIVIHDRIRPIMVCRELTTIGLTIDGTAQICAEAFDEGSYDNCVLDSLAVKLMDEPDSLFRKCLLFTCHDTTAMVVLRGYDLVGNHNECMIELTVFDKLKPDCIPPEDVWTTCEDVPDYYDLTDTTTLKDLFGEATFFDNCKGYVEELTPNVDIDMCGSGTIIRNFRAHDGAGNRSINACRQRITVKAVNEYKIYFPADWEGECGEMENADTVRFREIGCDRLAKHYEDLRFDISDDGACYKIIRTWTVLNWCSYDGYSDPIEIPNSPKGDSIMSMDYGAHGYYTYIQLIKVSDDEAPVVSYDGDFEFCSTNNACTGRVNILPDVDEECTTDVTLTWRLDLDKDGSYDANGSNRFNRMVPLGEHSIRFFATDGCGNTGVLEINFEVVDCKKPTPVCHNGLSGALMQGGMLEIWAVDFNASSFDNCTEIDDLKYRINRIEDINRDGVITPDDYIMTVPTTSAVTFDCDHLGLQMVQMWVGDDYGNWDYCVTFIEIQDNISQCGVGSKMAGNIATHRGDGVMNVKVELSGNSMQSIMTDDNGMFEFSNVANDHDYTIRPLKNDDPLNGISTYDLVLISGHVLNTKLLTTPYQIIAADANRSGNVSTLDIVELRKMILRINHQFSNNTSWRFVDKDFIFSDPRNPLAVGFPEAVNYNNLSNDELDANFIAVKIGDINGDAETNALAVDDRTFAERQFINVENQTLKVGEETTIRFDLDESLDLLGFQFTLEFDPAFAELIDIAENNAVSTSNFGLAHLDKGIITSSWHKSNETDNVFFELTFAAKAEMELKDLIKITSQYTTAEAYSTAGELKDVTLNFGDDTATSEGFALYQNKPNPFREGTSIGFELPEAMGGTLTIFSLSGKVVKVISNDFPKGYNQVEIDKNTLLESGVYYYRLETDLFAATRKMIYVK